MAAVAVSTALCAMTFVTCLSAAELPARDMACCAAMQHDCHGMSMESSCCVAPAVSQHAVVPPKPAPEDTLVGVLVAILMHTVEPPAIQSSVAAPAHLSPSPPGVPLYLFVSTFRI
jgi:hypothetical protein